MNRRKILRTGVIAFGALELVGGIKLLNDYLSIAKVEKNLGTSVDLHSHTIVTYEGSPNLEELTNHCINIGLDVLVFTNFHDSRYEDLKKTASQLPKYFEFQDLGRVFYISYDNKLFTVIKGQEVPTKQGHILTVGATKDIKDYRNMRETIDEARDKDAIIIADHPFTLIWGGMGKENLEKYSDKWDAVEIFNSQNIMLIPFLLDQRKANGLAEEIVRDYNLPGVATSDSHRLNEVALSYITFKQKINYGNPDLIIASLRDIIRKKEFENVKKYNSWGSFVSWALPFQIKVKLGFYEKE